MRSILTENRGYFNPHDWSKEVKSGGMVKHLVMRKGASVVMTVNHTKKEYKEDSYIDCIQTSCHDNQIVKVIWVVFQNEKVGHCDDEVFTE